MLRKKLLIIGCWGFLLPWACVVPQNKYIALETALEATQSRYETERRQAEDMAEKNRVLEAKCTRCLEDLSALQNSKDLSELETRNAYLKNINQQLLQQVDTLKRELEKKSSVIQLQEDVIRLLDDTQKTIESSLKDQIAQKEIELVSQNGKLKMIFIDQIFFDSGSFEINEGGKAILSMIADAFRGNKKQEIVVEGHTDNLPLGKELKRRFPSNWELSAARATAVVRFLQEEAGVPPERLSARGYSYFHPVASNDTEEGRHKNRRIEIILQPL